MRYVKLNATDISVTVTVVDDSGLPVTGLNNATFPTVKYRKSRAAAVTISLSALSAITDAHSDGGVIESGEGRYRLDLPDAVATSLDTVEIFGEATDKRLIVEKLQIVAFDPESATNLGLSNLDAAVSSRSTYNGSDTAGTTTLLSRLTAARAGYLDNIATAPPTAATIASAVHNYDYSSPASGETFIGYIQATFSAASNVDTRLTATRAGYLDGLNVASLSTRLGTLPTSGTVMTTADYTAPLDAAGVRTAIGLSSANLDTQLSAIVADTNELQTDWANGGRLDLLLDATLADTNELQGDWANGGRLDLILDAVLADTDAVETRLTSTRAAYLDNISTAPPSVSDINAGLFVVSGRKLAVGADGSVTAGSVDVDEAAIAAAVLAGLGGTSITLQSVIIAGGRLVLNSGDAYNSTNNRTVTINATWSGASLDGATVTLRFIRLRDFERLGSDATPELEVTTTASQTGTALSMPFQLSAVQTALLTSAANSAQNPIDTHIYKVRADATNTGICEGPAAVNHNPIGS